MGAFGATLADITGEKNADQIVTVDTIISQPGQALKALAANLIELQAKYWSGTVEKDKPEKIKRFFRQVGDFWCHYGLFRFGGGVLSSDGQQHILFFSAGDFCSHRPGSLVYFAKS